MAEPTQYEVSVRLTGSSSIRFVVLLMIRTTCFCKVGKAFIYRDFSLLGQTSNRSRLLKFQYDPGTFTFWNFRSMQTGLANDYRLIMAM